MLAEYLFVDHARLQSYAEQIGAQRTRTKLPGLKVGLALTGPSVEGSQSVRDDPATTHKMVSDVLGFLKKQKMLLTARPSSSGEVEGSPTRFVLESMSARKIVFELPPKSRPRGLRELAVWVSNPTVRPSERPKDPIWPDPVGMFLYLLEGYWESDGQFKGSTSEYSALNHLLEELTKVGASPEPEHGRTIHEYASPAKTLQDAGGVAGPVRQIQALYRMRAVSDNQFVLVGSETIRAYDLFAYPIAIVEGRDVL